MQPPRPPLHPVLRLRQRAGLIWLLLALVWVPTLGRLHQAAHGGQGGHAHGAQAAAPAAGASHFLATLLADHTRVDCLLLDQLALADAAPGAPLALPPAPPAALPVPACATGKAPRFVALFHARGPPPPALG